MRTHFIFLLIVMFLGSCNPPSNYNLRSPDGEIKIRVSGQHGQIRFTQTFEGDTIITRSPIGLMVDSLNLTNKVAIQSVAEKSFDSTWETVAGKNDTVRNHYREYIIHLQSQKNKPFNFKLIFRCYNDGFAYRYVIPKQEGLQKVDINKELTELNFKHNYSYWAYKGDYNNIRINRSKGKNKAIRPPMVLKMKAPPPMYMSIQEAAIFKQAPFNLKEEGNKYGLQFTEPPIKNEATPIKTAWRSFIVGHHPGDMVESNMLVNLNEPSKIKNTSWIKPGKSLWDWRVRGYKTKDGFVYGKNEASAKRFIDFAAANNIQYVLFDELWYSDKGPQFPSKELDMPNIIDYAKNKNVGVWLYLERVKRNEVNLDWDLKQVLKTFHQWGAAGVKYGFLEQEINSRRALVDTTRTITRLCAKYKLMVDFHDHPIPPSGDRRTWPNLVTREFGHAQADALRSTEISTPINQAFINMIAGPLDMTYGWFDLNNAQLRERVREEISGTVTASVAKLVIIYSGLIVLPDAPEEYFKKDDLFDCVRKMPSQFNSFRVQDGKIGKFISVVRRAGDNWFIGSLTNKKPRTITIDFSFLPKGGKYKAVVYEDGKGANYWNNKESYNIRNIKEEVDSGTQLKVRLAPGGGNVIYLKQI